MRPLSLLEISVPQPALIDARLEGKVTAEELASAFQRLGTATVYIGGGPGVARLATDTPPRVATVTGGFCPSAVFKIVCEMIREDGGELSPCSAVDGPH